MKKTTQFVSTLFFCFCFVCYSAAQNVKDITIVVSAEMPDISNSISGRYAELQHLVLQHKEKSESTFFIFGGASIGPSALSNLDRGSHIIDLLNSLEPDAMGVSKSDFSYLENELSLRSYEAAFPIVASNIADSRTKTTLDGLVDNAIITKGKIKLGFLSVVNKRLIDEYLLKNVSVSDAIVAIETKAKVLREAGADIILLHYFYPYDFVPQLLDEQVIDIAFNSNTRLFPSEKQELAKHAKILAIDSPGNAIVAELELGSNISLRSSQRLKLLEMTPDPTIQAQVNAYKFRLDRLLDDRIGYWDGDFSTQRQSVRTGENAFGNYIVDTMRTITGADTALINGGSIRGRKSYSGNTAITRRTIASELPFRSTLNVISIKGQYIRDALEVGLSGLDELKGTFPHISGMQLTFNSKAVAGQRIVSLTIGGKKLVLEKMYTLATTDYLFKGGDGYKPLSMGKQIKDSIILDNILISDLIMRNIRLNGKLSSKIDNRLVDASADIKN